MFPCKDKLMFSLLSNVNNMFILFVVAEDHFVARDCVSEDLGSFCYSMPGMDETMCVRTCKVSGCNGQQVGDEVDIENMVLK